MRRTLLSALTYATTILALGFVLGILRVLAVAPRTRPLLAVALELPLMLAASAWLARRLVHRAVLDRRSAAAMGVIALVLLLTAERGLAGLFGQSGAKGLAGQVWFGVLPWGTKCCDHP